MTFQEHEQKFEISAGRALRGSKPQGSSQETFGTPGGQCPEIENDIDNILPNRKLHEWSVCSGIFA